MPRLLINLVYGESCEKRCFWFFSWCSRFSEARWLGVLAKYLSCFTLFSNIYTSSWLAVSCLLDFTQPNKRKTIKTTIPLLVEHIFIHLLNALSLYCCLIYICPCIFLFQSNDRDKAADVFYDPADEWEPDLSDASVSSLTRRR